MVEPPINHGVTATRLPLPVAFCYSDSADALIRKLQTGGFKPFHFHSTLPHTKHSNRSKFIYTRLNLAKRLELIGGDGLSPCNKFLTIQIFLFIRFWPWYVILNPHQSQQSVNHDLTRYDHVQEASSAYFFVNDYMVQTQPNKCCVGRTLAEIHHPFSKTNTAHTAALAY